MGSERARKSIRRSGVVAVLGVVATYGVVGPMAGPAGAAPTDVSAQVTTVPSTATVMLEEVNIANSADACDAIGSDAEFSFKTEGATVGTHTITTGVTVKVTELTVAGKPAYTLEVNGGVLADALLKSQDDRNNHYAFTPSVTYASPLVAPDSKEASHMTFCVDKTPPNEPLRVDTTATPAFGRAYTWTIGKDVDSAREEVAAGDSATFTYTVTVGHTQADSAWTVAGTITVTNPNDAAFTGVDVTAAVNNGGTCSVTNGQDVTVPGDGSLQRAYSCTYAAAPNPAAGTMTATATWDKVVNNTETASAQATAGFDFSGVQPTLTDESVTVTDTMAGALGTVSALNDPNPKVFSYSRTLGGAAGTCTVHDNTAAFETNDTESTGSSSESVTVCVGADLTVVPVAAGSFDRTYAWTIDKAVDLTSVTVPNGEDATFTYTVAVQPAGTTDSGHSLGGSLTVTNPNDWQDVVADVSVTADLGGGVTCAVTGGEDVVVPKGGSAELPFTCSFTGVPALSGTVTATATWDEVAYTTPNGTASAGVPVELDLDSETNRTITVVDDKTNPGSPVTLGTATYDEGNATFTYSLTQAGEPATTPGTPVCVDYTNIASIVETDQSDTQLVTLCHTAPFAGGGGGPVLNPPPPVITPPQGGGLPTTGDWVLLLGQWGVALLGLGLALMGLSRSRRPA